MSRGSTRKARNRRRAAPGRGSDAWQHPTTGEITLADQNSPPRSAWTFRISVGYVSA